MSTTRFSRYLLRTTDVAAATTFYDAVLKHQGDGIVELHAAAIARGARPHCNLGGSEAMAARFVERGAIRLGPPPDSGDFAVLRDPGGAIVALTDSAAESSAGVVWHQLNTREPTKAAEAYSAVFDWSFTATFDLGNLGRHRRFAFGAGETSIGLLSDVVGRPEVHTHWLFFFAVRSLDDAVNLVHKHGGTVIGPIELSNRVRVAVCDDPQGAAFGIIESEDAARLAEG